METLQRAAICGGICTAAAVVHYEPQISAILSPIAGVCISGAVVIASSAIFTVASNQIAWRRVLPILGRSLMNSVAAVATLRTAGPGTPLLIKLSAVMLLGGSLMTAVLGVRAVVCEETQDIEEQKTVLLLSTHGGWLAARWVISWAFARAAGPGCVKAHSLAICSVPCTEALAISSLTNLEWPFL
jgi:hypothetical protein